METNQKPIVNTEYTIEKFEDEVLLYTETGTQAVYLNDAAHAVWLLCKEDMTIEQIIQYLEEVYPEQKDQIRGDVLSALDTLCSHGVIEIQDNESA